MPALSAPMAIAHSRASRLPTKPVHSARGSLIDWEESCGTRGFFTASCTWLHKVGSMRQHSPTNDGPNPAHRVCSAAELTVVGGHVFAADVQGAAR